MPLRPVTITILHEFAFEEATRAAAIANAERRAGRMQQEDTIRISMTWRAICYWLTGESKYVDGWCWTGMNGNIEYLVKCIAKYLAEAEKAWTARRSPEPPNHGLHYDDIWQDWFRVMGYRRLHERVLELSQPGRKYEQVGIYKMWNDLSVEGGHLRRKRA